MKKANGEIRSILLCTQLLEEQEKKGTVTHKILVGMKVKRSR